MILNVIMASTWYFQKTLIYFFECLVHFLFEKTFGYKHEMPITYEKSTFDTGLCRQVIDI